MANILDFISTLMIRWSGTETDPGLWHGAGRPVIGLIAGLAWAWGIGRMLGLFYWGWIGLMAVVAIMITAVLTLSLSGFAVEPITPDWTGPDVIGMALVVAAFCLLISGPSLRAYWRHGRLVPRRRHEDGS